ncbi:hypothetical protein COSO111634_05280 [Corallococcus soli]
MPKTPASEENATKKSNGSAASASSSATVPYTLEPSTASQSAAVFLTASPSRRTPATWNTPWIAPKRVCASRTSRATSSSRPRSADT